MFEITIEENIQAFQRSVKHHKEQVPFAASRAINNTLKLVKRAEEAALDKYLDRPTPFTKKAYRIKFSNKRNLSGALFAMPIQNRYLAPQVFGGEVHFPKGHPVPGSRAKINAYGNLPRRATKAKNVHNKTTRGGLRGSWKVTGKKKKKVTLVGHFVDSATYKPLLPFGRIAVSVFNRRFPREMDKAFAWAVATAR